MTLHTCTHLKKPRNVCLIIDGVHRCLNNLKIRVTLTAFDDL